MALLDETTVLKLQVSPEKILLELFHKTHTVSMIRVLHQTWEQAIGKCVAYFANI